MENPQNRELRALKSALILYVIVFILKLVLYSVTNVLALLAEALHTLTDIFVSGLLFGAAIYSQREADEVHMFGYGRAQNVAALAASALFIFTGYSLYEESIPRLFFGAQIEYQNLNLALAVVILSMVLAGTPMIELLRQKKRGAAAKAQLVELMNDELGLTAALIGTLLISWGKPIADPIATMVVATIIVVNAVRLFRQNASFLLGRSPGGVFIASVEHLARSVEGVADVHAVRAEYIGPDMLFVMMHVTVAPNMSVEGAHGIVENVRHKVHDMTKCQYCVIHTGPAGTTQQTASVNHLDGRCT